MCLVASSPEYTSVSALAYWSHRAARGTLESWLPPLSPVYSAGEANETQPVGHLSCLPHLPCPHLGPVVQPVHSIVLLVLRWCQGGRV